MSTFPDEVEVIEHWRDWQRESDGLTWRVATRKDLPAIGRIWTAKARILGAKGDLPDLFAAPVVLTLVAEDKDGRVVDGAFFEAVIDCTKLGARPGGFRALAAIADELAWFFKSRNFRKATAVMPPKACVRMSKGLETAKFFHENLCFWQRWF